MSDPKSSYGEPVEEPTPVDDVVGRAEEGLADAEAARRDAVSEPAPRPTPAPASPSRRPRSPSPQPVARGAVPTRRRATTAYDADDGAEYTSAAAYAGRLRRSSARRDRRGRSRRDAQRARRRSVVAPVVAAAPRRPAADLRPGARGARARAATVPPPARSASSPRCRFAVLYLAAWLGFGALAGRRHGRQRRRGRARRARHLVAVGDGRRVLPRVLAARCDHQPRPLGQLGDLRSAGRLRLRTAGTCSVSSSRRRSGRSPPARASQLIAEQLYAPLAIAAFIIGRELTIWFGAWAAARGKRVTELNIEAQREYERTLEAGPQLVRQ